MSNVGWLAPSSSGHSGGDRQSHQEESSCPGSRNGGRFVDIAEAYELRLLQLHVVSTGASVEAAASGDGGTGRRTDVVHGRGGQHHARPPRHARPCKRTPCGTTTVRSSTWSQRCGGPAWWCTPWTTGAATKPSRRPSLGRSHRDRS